MAIIIGIIWPQCAQADQFGAPATPHRMPDRSSPLLADAARLLSSTVNFAESSPAEHWGLAFDGPGGFCSGHSCTLRGLRSTILPWREDAYVCSPTLRASTRMMARLFFGFLLFSYLTTFLFVMFIFSNFSVSSGFSIFVHSLLLLLFLFLKKSVYFWVLW